MKIPKSFLLATEKFSQLQLKMALFALHNYQVHQSHTGCDFDIWSRYNSFEAKSLQSVLVVRTNKTDVTNNTEQQSELDSRANITDLTKKIVQQFDKKFSSDNPLFSHLEYCLEDMRGYISYEFHDNIVFDDSDSDIVDFDYDTIKFFPNRGYSLRLHLILLFAIKNSSLQFTTNEIATQLFGGLPAYTPVESDNATANQAKSNNATANQMAKIKKAINDLNSLFGDRLISVNAVKTGRHTTGWKFSIVPLPKKEPHKFTNTDTIIRLLNSYGFDNIPIEYAKFIAMFCLEDRTEEIIQYITGKVKMLLDANLLHDDDNNIWKYIARKVVMLHYGNFELPWYTHPRTQVFFEQYIFTHPNTFVQDLNHFITKFNSEKEFEEYVESLN